MIRPTFILHAAVITTLGGAFAAAPSTYQAPADFTITSVVAAPNPGGWSSTTEKPPVENFLSGGEYEGFNFRTRFLAYADGENAIPLSGADATGWDTMREGFYDGATARVYRILDGKFVNVRAAKIAKHRASGWNTTPGSKLVPPGRHSYEWNFENSDILTWRESG